MGMLPREVFAAARGAGLDEATLGGARPADVDAVAAWLISPQGRRSAAVRHYLFFLKWMYETFYAIAESFPPAPRGAAEDSSMLTSGLEMLHLANHLYILTSYGVDGAVLECGCFRGFSSCCLSHACGRLKRRLVVADSFAGLPQPGAHEGGYQEGDFQASYEEVRSNVETYGCAGAVEYRRGWFRQSLKGWTQPLALLWIDVDLYESTLDVLENVYAALDGRGVLFSHEFAPSRIRAGEITHRREPPGALRDFFAAHGVGYEAQHVCGQTAMICFPKSVAPQAPNLLKALADWLRDQDHRTRAAREAMGLGNALRDFVRRTLRPASPKSMFTKEAPS